MKKSLIPLLLSIIVIGGCNGKYGTSIGSPTALISPPAAVNPGPLQVSTQSGKQADMVRFVVVFRGPNAQSITITPPTGSPYSLQSGVSSFGSFLTQAPANGTNTIAQPAVSGFTYSAALNSPNVGTQNTTGANCTIYTDGQGDTAFVIVVDEAIQSFP